jgi:4-hydroxyphenylpyruvate dioxygenase
VRRSIATVCLSGTLEDKLQAAARAGFDEVEVFEPDLIASALSPEDVRDLAGELGLTIGLYQPFRDFEAVPEAELRENLGRAARKFAVMERLGADLMLVCSNVSEAAIDDDQLAAAQLRMLAQHAAEHGIRIAYEALAWGRHVRDYDHAWRIVEAADHPNLGTCLDSFHILSRGGDPAGICAIPGEKIFYLQLADAPHLVMDVLQWSRHYRCFPGQGGFDLPAFLQHVLAAGYAGPLSLEVFNDVFRQADPERMAVDAMRSLLLLEEAAAVTAMPPAPPLRGYAFVELAVAADAAAPVERLLVAMGFRHAGQHRTKPVQLWRHGDTRILVNHDDGDRPGPRVAAIAVESPSPIGSAERAQRLLASLIPRDLGSGEADLSAVAAPDGTAVFFCRTDARDAGGWLTDFLTAGPPGGGVTADVTGIDHVALTQPFDFFDEAALFYRSVLGLELQNADELATPDGLVRSRAARSADGRVRFALSVPLVERDAFEFQHVALATDDVLGTARAMRDRGVPLLEIPDNYYDDLLSRSRLEADAVEAMSDLGVLYDATGDGELLHVYTEMVGPGLFFEFVERRGAYDGYGAANSPVRVAAQRAVGTRKVAQPLSRAVGAAGSRGTTSTGSSAF